MMCTLKVVLWNFSRSCLIYNCLVLIVKLKSLLKTIALWKCYLCHVCRCRVCCKCAILSRVECFGFLGTACPSCTSLLPINLYSLFCLSLITSLNAVSILTIWMIIPDFFNENLEDLKLHPTKTTYNSPFLY